MVNHHKRLTHLNELNTGSLILAGDYMIYPTFEAASDSGELAAERVMKISSTSPESNCCRFKESKPFRPKSARFYKRKFNKEALKI